MDAVSFARTAVLCSGLALAALSPQAHASLVMSPTLDPQLQYQGKILTGNYQSSVTPPDEILGFPLGQRVATPAQITLAITTWSGQSDRLKVVEYARSHEGRPLHAVFISSPDNLAKLESIEADIQKLADPRQTSDAEAKALIERLPAVAWMAYSIHGNETSGADSALAALYHLAAGTDSDVTDLLDDMVVVIDPVMNPDGRDRFAKSLEQYRGTAPNVDDQSLLHTGDWPYGRTNHYFFDLNRDFFYLTQPETRGMVSLINRWRPQLMIDGHEMGPQDTYLMGPPRQPLNHNIPPSLSKWAHQFSKEQGAAFDERGWRYYTGEWFENWYPGYSNYAEYRGTMHILYEQSRMAEDGVRRPEGTIQTYMESVHHQYVSTLVNLESLATHSKAMYADYWQERQRNLDPDGPFADRTFVVLNQGNGGRMAQLVERLQAQDIEVFQTTQAMQLDTATDHLGQQRRNAEVPAGSLVVLNRQPEAPLIAAILEFDAAIHPEVLVEERQKTLRDGSSVMYDTTAWNLTMMYGMPALTVNQELSDNLEPYQAPQAPDTAPAKDAIAWAVQGNDDRSVAFAARLMERGVQVRLLNKATQYGEQPLVRGSVVVTITDNPDNAGLTELLALTARELELPLHSFDSGYGKGDLPDWGGEHLPLLARPQVGILAQGGFSSYDVGATWWSLDHHLGIRHSALDSNRIARADLRRYNVLILPHGWGNALDEGQIKALATWVRQGGTLIAHQGSAASLASEDGIGSVRQLKDVLDKAEHYDIALQREWLATADELDMDTVMGHSVDPALTYPWDGELKRPKKEALKRREDWQKRFMPSGAMVAGNVDEQHWLSVGVSQHLPLLYANLPILMADEQSEAVVRVGVRQAKPNGLLDNLTADEQPERQLLGWSTLGGDQELLVRMSGLLWPEAAQRIANSAYLVRERVGKGQVILFAGQPNFRGASQGTNRLLLNAVVYGPGLGTKTSIRL